MRIDQHNLIAEYPGDTELHLVWDIDQSKLVGEGTNDVELVRCLWHPLFANPFQLAVQDLTPGHHGQFERVRKQQRFAN